MVPNDKAKSVDDFLLFFSYAAFMYQGAPESLRVVIRCKGCGENIPAPVETMPAQPIVATCPLCGQQRRYLPSQVFQGRLSWKLLRKPVRSAEWG
jgi:RNase P subunit RPR2